MSRPGAGGIGPGAPAKPAAAASAASAATPAVPAPTKEQNQDAAAKLKATLMAARKRKAECALVDHRLS